MSRPTSQVSADRIRRARKLFAKGMPLSQVAGILGVSHQTVHRIKRTLRAEYEASLRAREYENYGSE